MVHDFRKFLQSEKFIWVQFAWLLWTNIRHVAILRIPWCIFVSLVKLVWNRKWESPVVRTKSGAHLAIIGRRDWQDYTNHEKGKLHPDLQQDDCDEILKDTYLFGIHNMSFVCNGKCLHKVVQACLYGTKSTDTSCSNGSQGKATWHYEGPKFNGLVEGFYELTNEIVSGVYVVEEIPQVEFLRRIVEGKGQYQLESTDWWVTGYHDDALIFRSRWSALKTDSRLYNSLAIIPIFLTSRFSREAASIAFLTLLIIDLLLPVTSQILNLIRYLAKTRLQLLVSRIPSWKARQLIFTLLTGFRPGMKPCLDKTHKVLRLEEVYLIVFPKETPVCLPFSCVRCDDLTERYPDGFLTETDYQKKLEDGSVIRYKRRPSGSRFSRRSSRFTKSAETIWLRKYEHVLSKSRADFEFLGVRRPVDDVELQKSNSKLKIKIKFEVVEDTEDESTFKQSEDDPGRMIAPNDGDLVDCAYALTVHGGDSAATKIWEGKDIDREYTPEQRNVLGFYLQNMDKTFSVEACNSRLFGSEFCLQPKKLYDTLDDIDSNPHCLIVRAKGKFLVGPSVPKPGSRLFKL